MRLLFATTPGVGHVQPVIPLAVAAVAAGHDVVWVTGPDAAVMVAAAGVPTAVIGAGAAERAQELGVRYPESADLRGPDRAAFMFPRIFGEIGAGQVFPALLDLARAWGPDVIVHEQAELAAPVVAAALGVPNACHSYGLAVPESRIDSALPFLRPLWDAVGLDPRPHAGCYRHLYIDVAPPSLQPDPLPHLGRRILRRPASADARPGEELPPAVSTLVASGRPLTYVTFGTVFNRNPVFATVVGALADVDGEVLVTVGPDGDVEAFGPLPANVHVERYVPQSLLLPHVDVVVSHAGSGTFLTALAHGLPQLCLPQAADQFGNAAACERAGAGLALRGDEITTSAVQAALERLVADPAFRRQAQVIAREIAAMPDAAAVVPVLEELAGRG